MQICSNLSSSKLMLPFNFTMSCAIATTCCIKDHIDMNDKLTKFWQSGKGSIFIYHATEWVISLQMECFNNIGNIVQWRRFAFRGETNSKGCAGTDNVKHCSITPKWYFAKETKVQMEDRKWWDPWYINSRRAMRKLASFGSIHDSATIIKISFEFCQDWSRPLIRFYLIILRRTCLAGHPKRKWRNENAFIGSLWTDTFLNSFPMIGWIDAEEVSRS